MYSKAKYRRRSDKSKKYWIWLGVFLLLFVILLIYSTFNRALNSRKIDIKNINTLNNIPEGCIGEEFKQYNSSLDTDQDGIDDQLDVLQSAQKRTNHSVTYIDKYYSENGGKPPDNEGVCTDLFWRALEGSGFDFQELLYQNMLLNTSKYPLGIWGMNSPNKSIDFRRVPNIEAYLQNHAEVLSIELIECEFDNLSQWQGGDIVIFNLDGIGPSDHISIVSDKRNSQGVPYLIHNWGIGTVEDENWFGEIKGHYRWN